MVLQRPSHPIFPDSEDLKIEPWIINGWQSYARYNGKPGLGGQILWRPKPYLDFVWNNYGLGEDDSAYLGRSRIHADYSAQVKVYDQPKAALTRSPLRSPAISVANMAAAQSHSRRPMAR